MRSLALIARWLATRMLNPGGVLRPFWLAVRTTSSSQSSKRISSDATEHTASSAMSVSGECCLTSWAMWAAGDRTPVEVSTDRDRWVSVCVCVFAS